MTNSKLRGIRFGTISDGRDDELLELITARAGKISICVSGCPKAEKKRRISEQKTISQFANQVLTGQIDMLIFETATGVNYLINQVVRNVDRERFLATLCDITTIAGSKRATEAFRQHGVEPTLAIEKKASWRELLISIDQKFRINNFNLGLEESDSIDGLSAGLEARGGRVCRIPIYPQDTTVLQPASDTFFKQIKAGEFDAILLTSPQSAARFCFLTKKIVQKLDRQRRPDGLSANHLVIAVGAESTELLKDRRFHVDFQTVANELPAAIEEITDQMEEINKQMQTNVTNLSDPASASADINAAWYDGPFMKACRGEPTDVTPIWMMRQAGRYMSEYREVRAQVSFLELCANSQLCSEVMCTAVNRLGVDAAIIFSDLLPILVPMGMDLEFVKGDGPVIHNPVRTARDIDRVRPLESNDELQFVMDTVTQTRHDLPADMPLIGFAGAPFTLASYMIEGGSSRNYANTKKLMYTDQGAWDQLMQHLTSSIVIYLNGQIAAGAQVVQLFDSWAGCLSFDDYKHFVHPYVKRIITSLPPHVPVINFATGNPALLPLLADTRAEVIGIDWRVRLDEAWKTVGHDRAVQGNLDPTVLLTDPAEIKRQAKVILDQAAGKPGHIFNLGHGILPMTPVDNAIALVDAVHELSQK